MLFNLTHPWRWRALRPFHRLENHTLRLHSGYRELRGDPSPSSSFLPSPARPPPRDQCLDVGSAKNWGGTQMVAGLPAPDRTNEKAERGFCPPRWALGTVTRVDSLSRGCPQRKQFPQPCPPDYWRSRQVPAGVPSEGCQTPWISVVQPSEAGDKGTVANSDSVEHRGDMEAPGLLSETPQRQISPLVPSEDSHQLCSDGPVEGSGLDGGTLTVNILRTDEMNKMNVSLERVLETIR